MTIMNSKGNMMPDDWYYHGIRILRFRCGCGKIHTFKKVIEKVKR
jgi:hypothetical protein